jgi:hypothetical protein
LILVLGTPRVSPDTIRDGLLQTGKVKESQINGGFSNIIWQGKDINGNMINVSGSGYSHPCWQEMQNHYVRETLVQSVGRGRGVTDSGIQVVVVSNEDCGIDLANMPLITINDSEDETFHRILNHLGQPPDHEGSNLAVIPIYNNIGFAAAILTNNVIQPRQLRSHLSTLHTHGLLMSRGGGKAKRYYLSDWVMESLTKNQT